MRAQAKGRVWGLGPRPGSRASVGAGCTAQGSTQTQGKATTWRGPPGRHRGPSMNRAGPTQRSRAGCGWRAGAAAACLPARPPVTTCPPWLQLPPTVPTLSLVTYLSIDPAAGRQGTGCQARQLGWRLTGRPSRRGCALPPRYRSCPPAPPPACCLHPGRQALHSAWLRCGRQGAPEPPAAGPGPLT